MTAHAAEQFAALVAEGDPPLDEASVLVAAHALPERSLASEVARFDAIAGGVGGASLDAVCTHLIDAIGFEGAVEAYHEPASSLLPLVLDQRRGIPLSLAIVAIEVGRRCGVPVRGVGMPGHFLISADDEPDRFVDLFHGGAVLDRSACREVFERLHPGSPWQESFLDPVGNLAMIARMLANLANAYRRSSDREALRWILELRLRLPDATDRDRRELAVLLGSAGQYEAAADLLDATGAARDLAAAERLRARLN